MMNNLFDAASSLNISRPLAFFDLETTGIHISRDRIVEIAILKVLPGGETQSRVERINPGIPIPAEASKIHGIYDADVAGKPSFKELSTDLMGWFENADLGGYNSFSFDVPFLTEEFLRAGIGFSMEGRKHIDVMTIFKKMEPRNLTAALKFYCGKDLSQAHSAEADIQATYDVLMAQLQKYPSLKNDLDFLHDFTSPSRNVDSEGKFVFDSKGVETINFGKHRGKQIPELMKTDPGYLDWMLGQDFSLSTKQVIQSLKNKYKPVK